MTYPNDRDQRNLAYDDNEGAGFGVLAAGAALLLALIVGIFMWNSDGQIQQASNERPMSSPSSTVTPPVAQPAPNAAPQANPPAASRPNTGG